jgi:hypothetical protein
VHGLNLLTICHRNEFSVLVCSNAIETCKISLLLYKTPVREDVSLCHCLSSHLNGPQMKTYGGVKVFDLIGILHKFSCQVQAMAT